ncbi:MAG: hypothetical protein ACRC5T_05310 [Cetobacterium sp.]
MRWMTVMFKYSDERKKEMANHFALTYKVEAKHIHFKGDLCFVIYNDWGTNKCLVFNYCTYKFENYFHVKEVEEKYLPKYLCDSKVVLNKLIIEEKMDESYKKWYKLSLSLIENIKKSKDVVEGVIVKFDKVINFKNVPSKKIFVYKKNNSFLGLEREAIGYSIKGWKKMDFEIIGYIDIT